MFKAKIKYLGIDLEIESDDFSKMHEAVSGAIELNRSFRYLAHMVGGDKTLIPFFRVIEGNEFYGVKDSKTGANVTYGTFKEKGRAIPFFPKGADGYYKPEPRQEDEERHD